MPWEVRYGLILKIFRMIEMARITKKLTAKKRTTRFAICFIKNSFCNCSYTTAFAQLLFTLARFSQIINSRMSYSHGLEKIYSFEVVNPNSVRPIATLPQNDKIQNDGTISLQKSTLLSKKEPSKKETTEAYPHAQSFDFGPKFSDGIRAARLDEPLES